MSKKSGLASALNAYAKSSGEGMNIKHLEKISTSDNLTQLKPAQEKEKKPLHTEQTQITEAYTCNKKASKENTPKQDEQKHIPFRVIGFNVKTNDTLTTSNTANPKQELTDHIIDKLLTIQKKIAVQHKCSTAYSRTNTSNTSEPIPIPKHKTEYFNCGSVFSMELTPPTNLDNNSMLVSGDMSTIDSNASDTTQPLD